MESYICDFKNPKAIELIREAEAIEAYVHAEIERLLKAGLPMLEYHGELLTEAAGLRVLVDDVELGIISEDELEDA